MTFYHNLTKAARRLWKNEIAKEALVVVLLFGCEYLFLSFGLRYAFGTEHSPLHFVSSGSMLPALEVGDLAIVKAIEPEAVSLNDIIVFHYPWDRDRLIIHRVVGIVEKYGILYFETKGDNNLIIDPFSPFPQHLLVGVVIQRIPYVGYIALAVQSTLGMVIVAILMALLIIYGYVIPLTKRSKPESGAELESKDPERRLPQ